jgi:ubiquinone/menaquinone biosynthesis C-methylase UbiE
MADGHWQLEGTAAELFERYLVPAITAKWAEDLVDRVQPRDGEAALDIACGTGIVARLAAKRMGRGLVTGLDLNTAMLAVARRVPTEGAAITWLEGSALDLPFPADSFDMVFCQQGLQFFPDQGRALGEICRVLKRSGRAALSVYGPIERTPGANAFALALDDVVGRNASQIKRGEHSFNNPTQLEALLRSSGFNAVDVQTVEEIIVFPSVLDYVRFQLLATPMTVLLKDRTESEREAIICRSRPKLQCSPRRRCWKAASSHFHSRRMSRSHRGLADRFRHWGQISGAERLRRPNSSEDSG